MTSSSPSPTQLSRTTGLPTVENLVSKFVLTVIPAVLNEYIYYNVSQGHLRLAIPPHTYTGRFWPDMSAHLPTPAVSPQLSTPSTDTAASSAPGPAYRLSDRSSLGTAISRTSSTVASQQDDTESINADFHREAYGPAPGEKGWDQYEVRFAPDDPEDPYNWSRVKRWYITLLGGMLVLNA